jgi:GT2 family glycosyltransferase
VTSEPPVSIVVLNHNGREHLQDCFYSLFDLDYPAERLEVICVDNGSDDGSVGFLRDSFPEVKVVEAGENLGFAAGCNLGAEAAGGEFLALVNNDMRVDRKWLRALLQPMDKGAGVICTGGRILSWEGEAVDFERGLINFYGMGSHPGSGAPAGEASPYEGPLLFASGGSLLVDRGVYLDAGGMDPDYFAFFEDVDLGWRLRLYGYQVVAAPEAISYHRFHGTAGKIADFRLVRLYERNALFTLIKNVGEEALNRLLLASFMLAVRRARF